MRIGLTPGSMGVAKHAIDLFTLERVEVGTWLSPVWVNNLSEEEVKFAEEYFKECGITVTKEGPLASPGRIHNAEPAAAHVASQSQ